MSLNSSHYYDKIQEYVTDMVKEAMDDQDYDVEAAKQDIQEGRLDGDVDSFMCNFRYEYSEMLSASDNAEHGVDNGLVVLDTEGGWSLSSFLESLAYWAIRADMQNRVEDTINEFVEENFTDCEHCFDATHNDDILEWVEDGVTVELCGDCYDDAYEDSQEEEE